MIAYDFERRAILRKNSNQIIKNYHFAVYKHRLVIQSDCLITRQFIVLKDSNNIIIAFTNYHRYIHSSNKKGSKSIADNGNNRFQFVNQFLNYVFIDNYDQYKINSIGDITSEMVQSFFIDYGLGTEENQVKRTKQTVDRCSISVIDFLVKYVSTNKDTCKFKIGDFTEEISYTTKHGIVKSKYIPNFPIYYSNKPKTIFRDMPDSVFNIFMSYAAEHYKSIFFLMTLSAFAGLRPSEACNVRQEISPLGSGLIIKKVNSCIKRIDIDIKEEKNLRSDLKVVGLIKKERMHAVYPRFMSAFIYAYNLHKDYLSTCKYEEAYCPMSVNSHGNAMTYPNYLSIFKKMTSELIPVLLRANDPEVVEYGHELLEHNIAPHIFRHWFSVKLTLYGEDVAGLQYWRGDKSPESALTYLQNKGELNKQLHALSIVVFDHLNFQSKLLKDN